MDLLGERAPARPPALLPRRFKRKRRRRRRRWVLHLVESAGCCYQLHLARLQHRTKPRVGSLGRHGLELRRVVTGRKAHVNEPSTV